MLHRRRVAHCATVITLLTLVASAEAQSAPRPVTVANSRLITMSSRSSGKDFDIQMLIPGDYTTSTTKYPVLYVMDGQWDFKLLASIVGGLFYDKYIPNMIVVGITYPGENPNYDALRAVDLTPTRDGPKFLNFIETELMPYVQSTYRTDTTRRVLLGNSLGGLFTIYAMLSRPGLFYGYVASSPAVTSGNRSLFATERDFFATKAPLPARLFIGVGEDEPLAAPVKEFAALLQQRSYRDYVMTSRVIEAERHSGNKPETYNRGLRFVFTGKP